MLKPQDDNYSIIPFAGQRRVLLLQEDTGWTLPRHSETEPARINSAMQEQLGLTTTVLYCAYDRYEDDEREDQHRVYALENHSSDVQLPINGRWFGPQELANLPLAVPEHRSVLETWFARAGNDNTSEQRLPWMSEHWFSGATSWIEEQLARLGYIQSAPIEQVAVRPWSTVLRVPTTKGNVYFKAPAPAFSFEVPLAQTLSRLVPTSTPQMLVTNDAQSWMLMQDTGVALSKLPPTSARLTEALRQFAQMQITLADQIELLKSTGCPDRRLYLLPHLYEEVLAATPFLLIDELRGLPRSEYQQLLTYTPQLKEMCEEVASYKVPASIQHDDLHNNNIVYNGKTYIFIDVGEYCLGHPFCTMFIVLRVAKYILEYDDSMLAYLRDAYLEFWTRYASMERLQRAFMLAHRLGSLYKALNYYQVVSHLEPSMRWMQKDAVLYYLRVFLGIEE